MENTSVACIVFTDKVAEWIERSVCIYKEDSTGSSNHAAGGHLDQAIHSPLVSAIDVIIYRMVEGGQYQVLCCII